MLLFGFLNVWPSHPDLLVIRLSISILTWFVLSQRSPLLTLSIHYNSKKFPQALINKYMYMPGSFQAWPCSFAMILLHILQYRFHILVEETDFRCFAENPELPQVSQNVDLEVMHHVYLTFPKCPRFHII